MCEHKKLRCTNGEFFCLDCGAKVETPELKVEQAQQPEKKPARKTARKGGTAK